MSPLHALALVLLCFVALSFFLVTGWVALCALHDGLSRLRRGFEARSWNASAREKAATARARETSTGCATAGRLPAGTATLQRLHEQNRITGRGSSISGPHGTTAAARPHGDLTTAASRAGSASQDHPADDEEGYNPGSREIATRGPGPRSTLELAPPHAPHLRHYLEGVELRGMETWRVVALEAGVDLDDGLAEARELDGAA